MCFKENKFIEDLEVALNTFKPFSSTSGENNDGYDENVINLIK